MPSSAESTDLLGQVGFTVPGDHSSLYREQKHSLHDRYDASLPPQDGSLYSTRMQAADPLGTHSLQYGQRACTNRVKLSLPFQLCGNGQNLLPSVSQEWTCWCTSPCCHSLLAHHQHVFFMAKCSKIMIRFHTIRCLGPGVLAAVGCHLFGERAYCLLGRPAASPTARCFWRAELPGCFHTKCH